MRGSTFVVAALVVAALAGAHSAQAQDLALPETSNQTWEKDVAVSLTLPAATGGTSPYTYSLSGTPPAGMNYNTSTRILSGTPTVRKSYATYTYKVRDADDTEIEDVFWISVAEAPGKVTTITLYHEVPPWGTDNDIYMRWTTPATNSSPLTKYDVEECFDYALQPCPIEGEYTGNTTQVKHEFGRNVWDVNFWIRIRAVNLIGAGPWSDKVYFNAPTVNIPDQTWVEDIAVSVTLPAATNGVAPRTYSLAGTLPTGVSYNTSTRVLSGTPSAVTSAATYTYKIEGANSLYSKEEFTIAVAADTDPQFPTSTYVPDQVWVQNATASVTLPQAINGNAPLTYSLVGTLPTGVSFAAATRVLSGTPSALQNAATYTYKVRDFDGDEDTDTFTVTVETDTQPTLSAPSDQIWVYDAAISALTLPAASSGNSPLTYSITPTPPATVSYTSSGVPILKGKATAITSLTTYTYKVRDANGDEASDKFTITVQNDHQPRLQLSNPGNQSWLKDIKLVDFYMPEDENTIRNLPHTHTLTGKLPTGVSINSDPSSDDYLKVSGTPTETQDAVTYTYEIEDANGDKASFEFTIEVTNRTPSLSGASDLSWLTNTAYSVTLPEASDGDQPLTYSLTGTLPTGISFDASTRVLSGKASSEKSVTTYTYKVEDKNHEEASDTFTLEITNDTPSLTSTANQSWPQNVAISPLTLPQASGGDPALTYSLVGTLPAGVSFDADKRELSGTPSAKQDATTYTWTVEDANGDKASNSFTIAVVNTDPSFSSVAGQSWVQQRWVQNVAISVMLPEARDGDGTLTYSVIGQLPTGVNFVPSTRTLSGTPTVLQNVTTYTYKVRDVHGDEATTEFTIAIAAKASEDDSSDDPDPCASIPGDLAPTRPLLEGIPFLRAGPSLTSGDKEFRVRMPTARTNLAPVLAWNYKLDHYRTASKQGTWNRVPEVWLMDRSIPVTVRDSQAQPVVGGQPTTADESPAKQLIFSQAELAVARGGAASYTVRLATQPSSDVTVTVAAQSESAAGLTVSLSQLTFSTSDWNRDQIVTVSATEVEGAYRQAIFKHAAGGGGYGDVTGQVTAHESDSGAKALALSVDMLEVGEGNTVTYALHLASKPDSEVVLTIWQTGDADLSVDADSLAEGDQTTLTFTPANWNIPRTITVTAGQDEDALNEAALLEHALAGDGFGKRISELKNHSSYATCKSVYLLTVQATNRIGVSAFSTAVQATPTAETPVAPANLRAEPGPGQVTLSWSDPNDDSVTGYEYRYTTFSGTAGDSRGLSSWRTIEPTTSHVVEGARFGVRYTFEVRALQGDQRGAISRATAIPALAKPASKEPKGFLAIWTNSGEARLQWDAEPKTAGYEYRYSSDDGVSWSEWLTAAPDCDETSCDSTVTVEGNPEAYEFELRRASSDSASSALTSPSDKDIARARTGTHPSAPKAPTLLSSTPDGPTPADRWELEWITATEGESPTGWQYRSVYLGHRNGSLWTAWTDMQPSTDEGVFGFTVMIDDSEPKGQRMFQVRGTNALGVGEPSNVR